MHRSQPAMTITEFLLARIAEDEEFAKQSDAQEAASFGEVERRLYSPLSLVGGYADYPAISVDSTRVLAECEAKRRIVELHQSWPVMVTTEPKLETGDSGDINYVTMRLAWLTEQEYRTRFGDEPPTAPMLRALASVYADHPHYNPEWRE